MITMKNVITDENPLLRQKSVNVELPLSEEDETTLRDMIEYIYNSVDPENEDNPDYHPAVGIAAPQIGVLKKMLAIVAPDENYEEHEFFLVNPRIISYSDELTYLQGGEGCLSVPRQINDLIHRPKRITFEAYVYNYETKELTLQTIKLKGYLAVVFQHEYDHLNGVLFYDHANKHNPKDVPSNSTPIKFLNEK